jgi:segregation and condensation protein A
LQTFLPPGLVEPFAMRSATASTFAASLEMVKQGQLEIRQAETFGPIYLRRNKNKK